MMKRTGAAAGVAVLLASSLALAAGAQADPAMNISRNAMVVDSVSAFVAAEDVRIAAEAKARAEAEAEAAGEGGG